MRKIYLLFSIVLLTFLSFSSEGQQRSETLWFDINIEGLEVPPLIFTEFRGDMVSNTYVELTNVGETSIDLSKFAVVSGNTYTKMEGATDSIGRLGNQWGYVPLSGTIEAGESYVMSLAWDGLMSPMHLPRQNIGILSKSDYISHMPETTQDEFLYAPEYEAWGKDSIDKFYAYTRMNGSQAYYLMYEFTDTLGNADSTLVDNVNFSIDDQTGFQNGKWGQGNYQTPVAGVTEAIDEYILIRKSNVKQGNMDWHQARGTDLVTSEWLPIPEFNDKFNSFTTLGTHGNFEIEYGILNDKVSIDEAAGTLTVPWELARGETLSEQFSFGDGMSWEYVENATDSLYNNVQNGDIFTMYSVGEEIKRLDLTIQVTDPESDIAIAYPRRIYTNNLHSVIPADRYSNPDAENPTWRGLFQITQGLELDSIYNIPYGTPVDTLLKYIYVPENGSYEMQYLNDETRVNLKEGDKLLVTSEDGANTKEYIIMVRDYNPSTNARLSLISWPDYDQDIYWEWASDTIPNFDQNRNTYTIRLADGTKSIPALQFKPQSANATIEVQRAVDINGTIDQRTTMATVTAEDGETTTTYYVTFEIETVPVQPNVAEPFIAEMMWGEAFSYALEIYNPGNVELDMSNYMIVCGGADENLAEALQSTKSSDPDRIYRYVYPFGHQFKHHNDWDAFKEEEGYLESDNITNAIVKANDVFVFGTLPDGGWPGGRFYGNANDPRRRMFESSYGSALDFVFYGWSFEHDDSSPGDSINNEFNLMPWGMKLNRYVNPAVHGFTRWAGNAYGSFFLLKIENDSVLNGSKDIYDPEDYTIVDRFQKDPEADKFYASGFDLRSPHWQGWSIRRKAEIWKGATEAGEGIGDSLGTLEANSQWSIYNNRQRPDGIAGNEIYLSIGAHTMNPITNYLSTVTSMYFEVTPGYEGELTITGDLNGLTFEQFLEFIDKADAEQTLELYDGSTMLTASDAVADGYTLLVKAGNGVNSTVYTLVNAPLNADNLLVAADGSGLEVSLSGEEGVVAGVAAGTTIKDLLANLIVPEMAVLNVVDQGNNLVPLTAMNFDSLMVDVKVGFNIMLEVVAQNGDIATYSLDFGTTDSDAILLSNVLDVDQDLRLVGDLPTGMSVLPLLDQVYANEGSSIKIIDKFGFEREVGILNYDDEILVTSADGTTHANYKLKFVDTQLAGMIMANVTFIIDDTQVKFPDGFMLKGSWNTMTGEYDTEWNDGAEHTALYDDGTHGDATAGDNIWTITLSLASDFGDNTWEWGFNDMSGNWVPSENIQFNVENATDVVTTYVVGTNGIETYGKNFRVYPNPATSELSVVGIEVEDLKLFSISGQQIEVKRIGQNKIDVVSLRKGVYVLKIIETNGTSSLAKFIKN